MTLLLAVTMQALLGSTEPQGLANRSFVTETSLETKAQRFGAHTDSFGPLGNGEADAIALNIMASPGVSVLLPSGGPSTVPGFVVPGIVNTVQARAIGRAFAHVFEEGNEGLTPTSTDADSTRTVVFEAHIRRSFASADHLCPGPILGSPVESMSDGRDSVHGTSVTQLSLEVSLGVS